MATATADASFATADGALDACTRGSVGIGQLTHVEDGAGQDDDSPDELESLRPSKRSRGRHFGEAMGFGLHASVGVRAGNAFGRELLLRYCARPPFALERLSLLPDGRIAYRLKKPWRADQTHRVMTPAGLLARISAVIPPPRTPLIHFHGVFAPAFPRRSDVVPVAGDAARSPCSNRPPRSEPERQTGSTSSRHQAGGGSTPQGESQEPSASDLAPLTAMRSFASAPWRIDWSTLLHRVYDVDALACPCGGRLEFVKLVTQQDSAQKLLERLGIESNPAAPLAARVPDWTAFAVSATRDWVP